MTPTERLQAAIDKLEQLRKHGGVDSSWVSHDIGSDKWNRHDAEIRDLNIPDGFHDGIALVEDSADAELIVTLHRTIDAQLSLLRHAEKFLATVGHHTSNIAGPFIDDALTLADTINGTPALAEGADR